MRSKCLKLLEESLTNILAGDLESFIYRMGIMAGKISLAYSLGLITAEEYRQWNERLDEAVSRIEKQKSSLAGGARLKSSGRKIKTV